MCKSKIDKSVICLHIPHMFQPNQHIRFLCCPALPETLRKSAQKTPEIFTGSAKLRPKPLEKYSSWSHQVRPKWWHPSNFEGLYLQVASH